MRSARTPSDSHPCPPVIKRQRIGMVIGLLIGLGHMLAWSALPSSACAASSGKPTATSHAQTPAGTRIYRCKQEDGSMLYAQDPCPSAAGERVMQLGDARTEAQAQHGEEIQQRSDKLAKSLQRSRQSLERQARGQEAIALTPPPETEKLPKKGKASARAPSSPQDGGESRRKKDARAPKSLHPADFTARVPGTHGKGKKKPPTDKRQDNDEG